MGLLQQLFGSAVHLRHHRRLAGAGDFATHVEVGFDYQSALEHLVGGRTAEGANLECTAFLVPEPERLNVPASVAVYVSGYKVGYLSRADGTRYRRFLVSADRTGPALCDAVITGGWIRDGGEGYFAVQLDLAWPLRFEEDVRMELAA